LRVALVHDWLTGMRGGERVLHELAALFADADLYTLIHVPGTTSDRIERLRIRASPLSGVPGAKRHYRLLLPLFPWAIERFRLEGYELVLSTSHAVAKGVRTPPGTPHLCYCFTPMRYVWDQANAYLGRGLRRVLAAPLVAYLRHFDRRTSGPDRVTRFAAISQTVAERVRRHYGRGAAVVYPPVAVDRIRPDGRPPDDFFLLVAGFVPYKREEVAIEAFRRLDRRLLVVGEGPRRARLQAGAPARVEFTGRVSDEELARLYARCRALIFPSEEDFGLVPVEAQAAGRPVIAFGRGGARESVVEGGASGGTGICFERQTPEDLADAVRRFERVEGDFDPAAIRAHAERFGVERFLDEIRRQIDAALHFRDC
jgi:glycosyltransferase involved in cell wall biosynthesis